MIGAIASILGAAASLYSAANPPSSTSTAETSGTPAGSGGAPKSETIFNRGQPKQSQGAPVENISTMWDPIVQAQLQNLLAPPGDPSKPEPILLTDVKPPTPLPNPTSPTKSTAPGIGDILSQTGDFTRALAAAAPLLGLTDDKKERRQWTGSPAGGGGGGGAPVFQMPRRNTLAEILASLPRAG